MIAKRFYLLLLLLCSSVFSASVLALEVGERVPELDLPGKGQHVAIGKSLGKVIYIDFWASWCAPCRQSFPWMNAMQEKYKTQGLEIVGINLDEQPDDAERFLAKLPAKFTLAYDPQGVSAKACAVKGMPTSLLVGRDGKVLLKHVGFNSESRDALERQIQAALEAGK